MRGFGALLVLVIGCSRTFSGEAVQPNPLARPTETLRSSETITIVRGDMDLLAPEDAHGMGDSSPMHNRRYPLVNEAIGALRARMKI